MDAQKIKRNESAKRKCCRCQRLIIRKYNLARKTYSSKNDWYYWTEKSKNQGKFVCDKCLLNLYYNDKGRYLNEVSNEKKRRNFTAYVYNKRISAS